MAVSKGQKAPTKGRDKRKTRQAAFEKQLKAEQHSRAKASAARGGYAAQRVDGPSAALRADRLLAQRKSGHKDEPDTTHVHRYKSFNDRLANIKLDRFTGATSRPTAGLDPLSARPEDDDLYSTRFGAALAGWSELNMSAAFSEFSARVSPWSGSLLLLLHHRTEIADALLSLLAPPDVGNVAPGEKGSGHRHGFDTGLDLFPRLILDLGGAEESAPLYPAALEASLRLAGQVQKTWTEGDDAAAADIVERAFVCATALLKIMGPWMLRSTESSADQCRAETWRILRVYLGFVPAPSPVPDINDDHSGENQSDEEDLSEDEDEEDEEDEEGGRGHEELQASRQAHSYLARKVKVSPHVRRFASEALAHLIRIGDQLAMSDRASDVVKARNATLASSMLSDLQEMRSARGTEGENTVAGRRVVRNILTFARGVAGAWADACKSVGESLNTNAVGIASVMLNPPSSDPFVLARSLVTRLMLANLGHETKAKPFAEIIQLVLIRLTRSLNELNANDANTKDAVAAAHALSVCVAIRKGKRVDDTIKSSLFQTLAPIAAALRWVEGPLRSTLIKLSVFLIPTGRIQDQMTLVVKFFDALADVDEALFPIVASLANPSAEYSGFPQFALPVITKRAMQLSDSRDSRHNQRVLLLLANLMNTGRLDALLHPATPNPTTARFVRSVANYVLSVLEGYNNDEELDFASARATLFPAAQLAAALINSNPALAAILDKLVARGVKAQDRTWIADLLPLLGAAITNLEFKMVESLQLSALTSMSFLPTCYQIAIQSGPSDAQLFIALRDLLIAVQGQGLAPKLPDELRSCITYSALRPMAMASDVRIRSAAWDILLFTSLGSMETLVEELRDMEQIPLQADLVRNRQVKIQTLARLAIQASASGEPSSYEAVRVVVDALTSTLKVNLRPLWKDAHNALADVANAVPDLVFTVAFEELTASSPAATHESSSETGAVESLSPTPSLDAVVPQELFPAETGAAQPPKEWIDPQLAAREEDVDAVLRANVPTSNVDSGQTMARLDVPNYRLQILKLLSLIPQAVQQNNRPMVELFFKVKDDLVESVYVSKEREDPLWTGLGQKQRTMAYTTLLRVFSGLPHLRKVAESQKLRQAFLESCAAKDTDIQLGALAALLAYREVELTTYTKPLENLLGKSSQRDELVKFDLAPDAGQIDLAHRSMVLPVVQHIFFGQMTAVTGRRNKSGYRSRRIAMLNNLARCLPEELKPFFELMTMPFARDLASLDFSGPGGCSTVRLTSLQATPRQQRGFLSALADVLRYLRLSLGPYWNDMVGLILAITVHATRSAAASKEEGAASTAARALRQLGLRRLNDLFTLPVEETQYDWSPFKTTIIAELVSPRLKDLPVEGADSVGALHSLFISWSKSPGLARWLGADSAILPQLFALLATPAIKEPVASAVLSVMENLTELALPEADEDESDRDVALSELIGSVASLFTRDVAVWCRNRGKRAAEGKNQILLRATEQLIKLGINFDIDGADASLLFDTLAALVAAGSLGRTERLKSQVLAILSGLLSKLPREKAVLDQATVFLPDSFISLLAKTLSEARLPALRAAACAALSSWAAIDDELQPVAHLVTELNAYDRKRLDEIDIDRRLTAFEKLDDSDLGDLQTFEQLLLLANAAIFIHDEDMAVRSNASSMLNKFIFVAAEEGGDSEAARLLSLYVIPTIKKALVSGNDLVRVEGLRLLASLVKKVDYVPALVTLRALNAGEDEEASFFENVLHIQTHRRTRALTRLANATDNGLFSSAAIKEYLLPMVRKIFNDASEANGRELDPSMNALSALVAGLDWRSYYHSLSTYLSMVKERSKEERTVVRLVIMILQRFPFTLTDNEAGEDSDRERMEGEKDAIDVDEQAPQAKTGGVARTTVLTRVTTKLIPTLLAYMEPDKDSDDDTRIPIAMGVVHIVKKLPSDERMRMAVRLYRSLANTLRARAQSTRDMGRDMILKVQKAFGSESLYPLAQTLQTMLTRDAQKATAAYVVHDLLFHVTEDEPLLALSSDTVALIMSIAREDMFGRVAEDRVTAEGKLKQREMKRSKSVNTVELLAKFSSGGALRDLLIPLREQMQLPMPNVKTSFNTIFRHLASGLAENHHITKAEMATLCFSLISESSSINQAGAPITGGNNKSVTGAGAAPGLISMRKRKDVEMDNSSSQEAWSMNAHFFVSLGLDLLLINLKKGRWDLADAGDRARLNGLVDPVGNTLFASESSIVESSLRAMTAFARINLPALASGDKGRPRVHVLIEQGMRLIKTNGGLHAELSQFALKLVSALLREIPNLKDEQEHGLKDQLIQLLEWTKTDLEEPAVQSALFSLLRVLLDQQVIVPIIYDVMDEVAKALVTNQTAHVRDSCRSLYLKFLLDYPHGKARHANQLSFLISNLNYEFEAGRLSVLELLRAVVSKFHSDALTGSIDSLFIGLVMRIANDDSVKVRETSTKLLQKLLGIVPEDKFATLLVLVHNWAKQSDKPNVAKLGLLCYLVAARNLSTGNQPEWLGQALRCAAATLVAEAEEAQSGNPDAVLATAHALELIGKVGPAQGVPLAALHQFAGSQLWDSLMLCLASPVRSMNHAAINFLSTLLSSTLASLESGAETKAQVLEVAQSLLYTTRMLTHSLVLPSMTEELGQEYRVALAQVAVVLYESGATIDAEGDSEGQEDEDESDGEEAGAEPVRAESESEGQISEADADEQQDANVEGGESKEQERVHRAHRKSPLAWWFSRVSFAVRNLLPQWNRFGSDKDNISRQAVVIFGTLRDTVNAIAADDLGRYLPHIIAPTSLFLDEASFKPTEWQSNMDIREAADKLQKTTQEKVGARVFAAVLAELRKKVDAKRRGRKNAARMQSITDPAVAARVRAHRQHQKHASRKRKTFDRQAQRGHVERKERRTRY